MKFDFESLIIGILVGALMFWIWNNQANPDLTEIHNRIERGNRQLDSIAKVADSLRLEALELSIHADSLISVADSLQIVANRRPKIIEIHEDVTNWNDADRDRFWIEESERSIHTP